MSKLGQTLRGYFWWTYPRGSVPYDIMVTLILAFIFITPIFVNFRDKPQCSRWAMASCIKSTPPT
jgi:hypothetical protein